MKPIIPYALLGLIGTGGALVGTGAVSVPGATPAASKDASGPVKISASLDRTALPAQGGEAFVRVSLEGVLPKVVDDKRVPVSLTLVIDRSGSMGGQKMEDARRAADDAIDALQPGDRVAVVSFDNGAVDHGAATIGEGDGKRTLHAAIAELFARGGTDMVAGLVVGTDAAKRIAGAGRVNRLLLLSDGQPNTEVGLKEQCQTLAQTGVFVTTLGLGQDYNEDLMSRLADAGLGHYYFVEKPELLTGIFKTELSSLATVVASNAVIELQPKNGVTITDVIGFNFDRSGQSVFIPAGDIYGGKTTEVLVRAQVPALAGKQDVVDANISYLDTASKQGKTARHLLAATFTTDAAVVASSLVPEVAAQAEQWHAARAYQEANDAYNRGDFAGGDKILSSSTQRLNEKQGLLKQLGFKSDVLEKEAKEQAQMQVDNGVGGLGTRGTWNKKMKKKAWAMTKGTAYAE